MLTSEQQQLIAGNLGLVGSIVRNARRHWLAIGLSWDDAFQDTCLFLCDMATKYDPAHGVRWSTFATECGWRYWSGRTRRRRAREVGVDSIDDSAQSIGEYESRIRQTSDAEVAADSIEQLVQHGTLNERLAVRALVATDCDTETAAALVGLNRTNLTDTIRRFRDRVTKLNYSFAG